MLIDDKAYCRVHAPNRDHKVLILLILLFPLFFSFCTVIFNHLFSIMNFETKSVYILFILFVPVTL